MPDVDCCCEKMPFWLTGCVLALPKLEVPNPPELVGLDDPKLEPKGEEPCWPGGCSQPLLALAGESCRRYARGHRQLVNDAITSL